jgi:hypothetical protein
VATVLVKLVAGLLTVTVALGTAAPAESETVPEIRPKVVCAVRIDAPEAINIKKPQTYLNRDKRKIPLIFCIRITSNS